MKGLFLACFFIGQVLFHVLESLTHLFKELVLLLGVFGFLDLLEVVFAEQADFVVLLISHGVHSCLVVFFSLGLESLCVHSTIFNLFFFNNQLVNPVLDLGDDELLVLNLFVGFMGDLLVLTTTGIEFGLESLVLVLLLLLDGSRKGCHLVIKGLQELLSLLGRKVVVHRCNKLFTLFLESGLVGEHVVG